VATFRPSPSGWGRKLGDIIISETYRMRMADLIVTTCLAKLGRRRLDSEVQTVALARR
jgi:hypothetical protein